MPDAGDVARMRAVIGRLRDVGVVVREMPGWESVGATWTRVPRGAVDHHDASSVKAGEWGSLGVIVAGRPGIPPPLSQFQVARCLDGVPKVAIIGAGRANHAGKGGPYKVGSVTVPADAANSWLYGIEKANNGVGEPYTVAALYALTAVTSAVADVCGVPRGDSVIGHKEWASRKSDPQYRMWRCREETAAFQPGRMPTPPPGTPITPVKLPAGIGTEEDDMTPEQAAELSRIGTVADALYDALARIQNLTQSTYEAAGRLQEAVSQQQAGGAGPSAEDVAAALIRQLGGGNHA